MIMLIYCRKQTEYFFFLKKIPSQVIELMHHSKKKKKAKFLSPSAEDLLRLTLLLIFAALAGSPPFEPCAPQRVLTVAPGTWFGEMFWLHQSVLRINLWRWTGVILKRLLHVKRDLGLVRTQRGWQAAPSRASVLTRCICVAHGLMGRGSDLLEITRDCSTGVTFDLSWPWTRAVSPLGEISAALCSKLQFYSFLCT